MGSNKSGHSCGSMYAMSCQTPDCNPNLALVGMHGPPEITGQALLESHQKEPVEGWDVAVANEEAVDAGVRYVKHNLALQFARRKLPARRTRANYELWRPSEVKEMVWEYDTAMEVHDCPHPVGQGEYVATGGVYMTELLRIAAQLSIRSVINQGRSPTLNNYAYQSLTVELSRDDAGNPGRRLTENVGRLRDCMRAVTLGTLPTIDPADFDYYDYEEEIHWDKARELGLDRMGDLRPFDSLPASIVERLGLPDDEYAVEYWNGKCSAPGEWFGGVLRRRPPPMELPGRPSSRAELLDVEIEYAHSRQ